MDTNAKEVEEGVHNKQFNTACKILWGITQRLLNPHEPPYR